MFLRISELETLIWLNDLVNMRRHFISRMITILKLPLSWDPMGKVSEVNPEYKSGTRFPPKIPTLQPILFWNLLYWLQQVDHLDLLEKKKKANREKGLRACLAWIGYMYTQ